jgi:hypothetical protein
VGSRRVKDWEMIAVYGRFSNAATCADPWDAQSDRSLEMDLSDRALYSSDCAMAAKSA